MKVWWGSLHFPLSACWWKIWNAHHNLKGKRILSQIPVFSNSDVTEPAQDPWFLLLSLQQLAFVSAYVINIEEVSLPSRTCFSDLNEKVFHPRSWIRPLKGPHPPRLWTCSYPFLCPLWAVVRITFLCNILVSSSLGKKELGDFGTNAMMRVIWVRTLVKSKKLDHHPGLSF